MLLSAKNVLKAMFVIGWCLCGWSQQPATVRETLPRDVTVAGIPGVIAPGAKWQQVWQGTDNADGIVGTADEGLLFAQEQPNTVRITDGKIFVNISEQEYREKHYTPTFERLPEQIIQRLPVRQ